MAQQYQVLARKWRPQQFDDVVGQEHVTTTLKNAIEQRTGFLAHAYLFVGPRGIWQDSPRPASSPRRLSNCVKGPTITPLRQCATMMQGNHRGTVNSLDVLEIDGALQ